MKKCACLKMTLVLWLIVGLSLNAECAKRKKLNVTVLDKETLVVINKAQVTVLTLSNGLEVETDTKSTDKDGQCKFSLKIDQSYKYKVYVSKSGYAQCIGSGNKDKVSEILISSSDDEDLILYLTLESQKSVTKSDEQVKEPKNKKRGDKEPKETGGSPVTNDKKPQKTVKQNVIEEEQPVTDSIAETIPLQENPDESGGRSSIYLTLIIVGIVVGFIWIMKKRYDKKCSKCGKWNSMVLVNREIEDKATPATTTQYRIHRKCKNCGNVDSYTKKNG